MPTEEPKKHVTLYLQKSLADRFEQATDKESVLIEYMAQFKKNLHNEFECMDEDILAFQGMLARAKSRFTEVKKAHLDSCYEVWEKIDEEMPSLEDRTKSLERRLGASVKSLKNLKESLDGVNGYQIRQFIENVSSLNGLLDSLDADKLEKLTGVAKALNG